MKKKRAVRHWDQKIYFFGGKGGVGKSTSASVFAAAAARRGKKTLLISTDPAHNIGDLFQQKIGGSIKRLQDHLWALEIDPEDESKRYIAQVKSNLKGMIKSQLVEEVHRKIDLAAVSPGADESALFDRIVSLILDEKDNYDLLVFDTAPTGHTIRLLSLPELMGVWVDGMLGRREKINENYSAWLGDGQPVDDPIYRILQYRKERFATVRQILLNEDLTTFIFVLVPERLPIMETERALSLLEQYKISVQTLIVNKVLPEKIQDHFFKRRKQQERVYLEQILNLYPNKQIIRLPMLAEDVTSWQEIEALAGHLDRFLNLN